MHSPPAKVAGPPRSSLAVVGGGVIGLTCALTAADAGYQVTIHDAGRDRRAAWVAGGMLGCLGEGHPGEEELLAMSAESVRRWPGLIGRLGDPRITVATDTMVLATTAADLDDLGRLARFGWSRQPGRAAGAGLTRLHPGDVREAEPTLGSRLRGGYLAVGEGAVDNRRLLSALADKAIEAGVTMVDAAVDDLGALDADQVLVAAGVATVDLCPGLPLHVAKGEILRLSRTSRSLPPPRHVVRARVSGRSVYLVPRDDGIVVGATQYEVNPDERQDGLSGPRVAGVADLLADATEVMPGLRDYELAEVGVGFRPGTPDGLPIIRRIDDRTLVATGHGRNGIVLAPYTADRVMELMQDAADSGSGAADLLMRRASR